MTNKTLFARAAAYACLAVTAYTHGVHAQTAAYPVKPIRLIVPFAQGGGPGSRRRGWFWGGDGALPPGWWHGVLRWMAIAMFAQASFVPGATVAQQYPTKPIRLIVPFAPGGPNDILGRLVGQKLTEQLGQTVVVENRGGAGGTIGLDAAAKSPGDGYTLSMGGSSNMTVAPALYTKLPYDSLKDFTPVILVAHVPYAVGVNPTVPAKNVKELIAIAKRKANYLSYGSSGTGSMSSLSAELFKSLSGTRIVHVPYKGTAPALTDVVSGQIDMMFADLSLIQNLARGGRLRLVAVTGSKRLASAPGVPTIAESGIKGYQIEPWFGVVGPAGVPGAIVSRLNGVIAAGLKSADVTQRLDALGYEAIGGTPEQFAATIRADIPRYAKIVKTAGIKAEL
ncbi:MAG TPA: tripartite tricarboxylate transporter substrate binding protein [Burkholderiales bacterium]|nr:tripartite tricarboxylate transporter substrate binding protein [Burkholderiales bacterium]